MRLVRSTTFAILSIVAGCYGVQDTNTRAADSLLAAAAGGSARAAAGQAAPPRLSPQRSRNAPSVTGSGGCGASDPSRPGVDPANFPGEGGAAAWLATICGRCGWTAQTPACRDLVYSVPFIDNPAYSKCDGIELASCIESNSCVCDKGEIPEACVPVKERLDECVREFGQ